ncbi:MAG: YlaN family protein [Thermicanus sp.]|nr:YlaN family protein [Thermicanus sp.]
MSSFTNVENEKALALLKKDAEKIEQLIRVQMENLTMPQCPLYEEVLDTQMFGLSREVDFAVRLGLISKETGKEILDLVEQELTQLYEAYEQMKTKQKGSM